MPLLGYNCNLTKYLILSIVRSKSTSQVKKSDLIKKLNYENKALYGAVKNEKDDRIGDRTALISSEARNDLSSEIYWLTQYTHVPDKSNVAAKPKRKPKSSESNVAKSGNIKSKTSRKKIENEDVKLPESLTKFKDGLLPYPVRPKKLVPQASGGNVTIPFDEKVLKALVNFPLNFSNDKKDPIILSPNEIVTLPSVGKILQATMPESSRKALMQWKTLKIAELGVDGFLELQKSHLEKGSKFHSCLSDYFKTGSIPEESSPEFDIWKSVSTFLPDVSPSATLVETPLVHPILKYKGVVDCVSSVGSELHVIEWKKSDRSKSTLTETYDAPLQLCAYMGALNADHHFDVRVSGGVVVVAYTNGKPADSFKLDEVEMRKYWKAWLFRLQEYWIRLRDGTLPEPI